MFLFLCVNVFVVVVWATLVLKLFSFLAPFAAGFDRFDLVACAFDSDVGGLVDIASHSIRRYHRHLLYPAIHLNAFALKVVDCCRVADNASDHTLSCHPG